MNHRLARFPPESASYSQQYLVPFNFAGYRPAFNFHSLISVSLKYDGGNLYLGFQKFIRGDIVDFPFYLPIHNPEEQSDVQIGFRVKISPSLGTVKSAAKLVLAETLLDKG